MPHELVHDFSRLISWTSQMREINKHIFPAQLFILSSVLIIVPPWHPSQGQKRQAVKE